MTTGLCPFPAAFVTSIAPPEREGRPLDSGNRGALPGVLSGSALDFGSSALPLQHVAREAAGPTVPVPVPSCTPTVGLLGTPVPPYPWEEPGWELVLFGASRRAPVGQARQPSSRGQEQEPGQLASWL